MIRLPADVAIRDVLLEQISQITNNMNLKFVNKQFDKIIYMVEDMSKVLLKKIWNQPITVNILLCV